MSDEKPITITIYPGDGEVKATVSYPRVVGRAGAIAALRSVLGDLESAGGAGAGAGGPHVDALPRFAAREWIQVIGRGPVALTSLDRDTENFAHLTGRDVIIDGMVYRCKSIEWFGHNRGRGRVGDSISIEVEGAPRAPASPPDSSPPVALVDAASPVDTTSAAEHPAPWRWEPTEVENSKGKGRYLVDANGTPVLTAEGCGAYEDAWAWIEAPAPDIAELIRLGPDMEAMLRTLEWSGPLERCSSCFCDRSYGHHGCKLAELLASLDAARKATP